MFETIQHVSVLRTVDPCASTPRKVSLLGLRFRGRWPWAQRNRSRGPPGPARGEAQGKRSKEQRCREGCKQLRGARGLRTPSGPGVPPGRVGSHSKTYCKLGFWSRERFQGCARRLRVLREVSDAKNIKRNDNKNKNVY